MYRQDFHLQTLTVLGPCHLSIVHACSALIWILRQIKKCRSRKSDIFDTVEFGHGHNERSWSSTFQILTQPCLDHLVVRYVDKSTIGFWLYRKDHLQTSVSQVFTDLDFSGSPVELELVFHCVLILPLTHWVSGPAFFLVVQACFAFFPTCQVRVVRFYQSCSPLPRLAVLPLLLLLLRLLL